LGAVSGLVAIAPASGYVAAESSIVIGLLGAVAARTARAVLARRPSNSGLADVFAVHAVAGSLGVLLTGVLATPSVAGTARNGDPIGGLIVGNTAQLVAQLAALASAAALAFFGGLASLALVRLFRGAAGSRQPRQSSSRDDAKASDQELARASD
jgi:Amt family ammonium transporter